MSIQKYSGRTWEEGTMTNDEYEGLIKMIDEQNNLKIKK